MSVKRTATSLVFADAAQAEGLQIKPSVNGDALFAKLNRKVRYV